MEHFLAEGVNSEEEEEDWHRQKQMAGVGNKLVDAAIRMAKGEDIIKKTTKKRDLTTGVEGIPEADEEED